MSRAERCYTSDDADQDEAPMQLRLGMGANGDWYLRILPVVDRFTRAAVRLTTSGTLFPDVPMAIAGLYDALGNDRRQARSAVPGVAELQELRQTVAAGMGLSPLEQHILQRTVAAALEDNPSLALPLLDAILQGEAKEPR